MSLVDYEDYLEVISDSFLRKGEVPENELNHLESLGELNNILTISSSEGLSVEKLSDLSVESPNFIEAFKSRTFQKYLEYKKVAETVMLPDWIASEVHHAHKRFTDYPLSPVEGVVEPYDSELANQFSADSNTPTIKDVPSTVFDSIMFSTPYGVDEDGYDIWVPPVNDTEFFSSANEDSLLANEGFYEEDSYEEEESEEVSSESFLALFRSNLDDKKSESSKDSDTFEDSFNYYSEEPLNLENIFSTEKEGTADKKDIKYSEPISIDSDGFDVWADSGLLSNSEDLTSIDDYEPFAGTVYGVDSYGFDIWVDTSLEPARDVFAELDNHFKDGLNHDDDIYGSSLGEFHGEVYGIDEDGFDVWLAPKKSSKTNKETSKETSDSLFSGSVYGIDEDGFDIWVPLEETESISDSLDSHDPFSDFNEDTNNTENDPLSSDPFADLSDLNSFKNDTVMPDNDKNIPDFKEEQVTTKPYNSRREYEENWDSVERTVGSLRKVFSLFG